MPDQITLSLDGKTVEAQPGESLFDLAKRHGKPLPHLCHADRPGFEASGNCRACMVEIEGERVLAPSCTRKAEAGMVVHTDTTRASKARRMIMELLITDQPAGDSHFWDMAALAGVADSRFPKTGHTVLLDSSHVAMKVDLDACIHCQLCVQACNDVQVNDVIGMAMRGADSRIIFDQDDPMGASTCVACGECVQACPTGALLPAEPAAQDFDTEIASVCPYCGVGCQLSFKVKDNRIVRVDGLDGPANQERLCVKGRFGFDYIHHPHRLTKPLVRREGAKKGLNVDPANPLSHFREATWNEALDVAANGLQKHRESIAGFGSAKCSNEEAYLFQKLIRAGFGSNNVDHCTRLCHASSVAALLENVGSGAVTATFNQIEHADVAIIIGSNAIENHPVAATYFKQFTKRGGKLIVLDPRGVGLGRYATHRVQFTPGADVALLNALMHVIAKDELYDTAYIDRFTEGWDTFKDHLKAYTPEAMAPLCGVPADELRAIAHTFARGKAGMIFWGMGVSQHIHGTDNARCLISLALMTGNVGKQGAGLHPLRGQNNVQGASDAGLIPMFLPDYQSVTDDTVREKFSKKWGIEGFSAEKGLTVVETIHAIHAGEVEAMYILGENPAMSDPDVNHARAALAKLKHLVVQDIFMTETAMFADVILPAAAWPEKDGTATNTNRQVQLGRAAITPPGLARPDWEITTALANRLGLNWTYTHPREVFAEMTELMPSFDNITWQRLEAENAVTYPSLSPSDPGQAIVFSDGFPRAGGRAAFKPVAVTEPAERPDKAYPFVLITGRQLEHWHTGTMTRRSTVLDAIEPEATCTLHPKTLRDIGIDAGGTVRLTTRRGEITLRARADRAVPANTVFVPFAYVEAAANILTNAALDPVGKIPEFKYAAVRVEAG
ncbi:MAG: formate dehydrogenase subunit alpha [Rhodobacteraceae bacterium]|nr:formate dehydrogenase subunit alpha [Paracoccaceae bacterium]